MIAVTQTKAAISPSAATTSHSIVDNRRASVVFPWAALGHSVTVRTADPRTGSKEAYRLIDLYRVKVPRADTRRINSETRLLEWYSCHNSGSWPPILWPTWFAGTIAAMSPAGRR